MKTQMWWFVATLAMSGAAHAADPLEDAATQQAAAQAAGATRVGAFLKGSDPKTDFNVLLEGNRCYWFSGVSAGKVDKLALYLWAPGAGFFTPRLTDAKSTTGSAVMAHCAKESGMYKLQAKIEGKGSYVIAVYGKEAPKQPDPPPATVPVAAAAPDLGPICDKAAASAAPGARRVGEFFEHQGNAYAASFKQDWSVVLEAGKCYWIIACGEPGAVKVLSLVEKEWRRARAWMHQALAAD